MYRRDASERFQATMTSPMTIATHPVSARPFRTLRSGNQGEQHQSSYPLWQVARGDVAHVTSARPARTGRR
jgi:hypothetical protein